MCGLAGILHTESRKKPSMKLLERMINNINHRGPDDTGYYLDENIGLAHARLSIIDVDGGHQPIHNMNNKVWVVFNGEVFNYIELRRELELKGYRFYTNTDTEVIVHLYDEYGESFVNYINGQFAIALWDSLRKKLILTRDRVGIAPLYYSLQNDKLIFASEIKSILPALDSQPVINLISLDQLFTYWSPLSPNSIFEGIFEIAPGEMLIYLDKSLSKNKYWEWSFPEDEQYCTDSQELLEDKLKSLIIDATKIRLRSDVPVAAYLSGGLDSSIIASIVNKYSDTSLKTFSIEFEDRQINESKFQNKMKKYLNTDHCGYLCKESEISDNFESVIWHTEVPLLRSAAVPMSILSAQVHDSNYKVVLTGEGADEVLGGYDIFKETKIRQFWAKNIDSSMRPALLKRLYPYLVDSPTRVQSYVKRFFSNGLNDPGLSYFSHIPRWITTSGIKHFYADDLCERLKNTAISDIERLFPGEINNWHPFNKAQFIEAKSLMPGYLLSSQGDRVLMKNSVEGRYPFLDYRLIEFVNKLHPKFKMKGLNEKYLLKKALGSIIPGEIIKRHKQPYRAPDISSFTGENHKPYVSELLSREKIKEYGYFDPLKVGLLRKKIKYGKVVGFKDNMTFMGILSTQLLHRLFIEGTNKVII